MTLPAPYFAHSSLTPTCTSTNSNLRVNFVHELYSAPLRFSSAFPTQYIPHDLGQPTNAIHPPLPSLDMLPIVQVSWKNIDSLEMICVTNL
jgi:hypothetical protein